MEADCHKNRYTRYINNMWQSEADCHIFFINLFYQFFLYDIPSVSFDILGILFPVSLSLSEKPGNKCVITCILACSSFLYYITGIRLYQSVTIVQPKILLVWSCFYFPDAHETWFPYIFLINLIYRQIYFWNITHIKWYNCYIKFPILIY